MKLLCLALAGALTACHPSAAPPAPKSSGDLETRVKALEQQNAKYAEALAFLQKVYDQQKAQAAQEAADDPADDAIFAVDIAPDLAAGQFEGPSDAPVTIVEAFDFACPYCRKAHDTLAELAKGGQVRIVYKNMVVHPQAMPAHLASCAAAKQGKYLAFANDMWTKGFDPYLASRDPSKLSEDSVIAIAKAAGIDIGKLKTDMHSDECANRIKADMDELDKFHVNATPTLFVNGTYLAGAPDETEFKELIAQKLATVKQSGVKPSEYYAKEIMVKGEKVFRSKKDPKRS